ncbi:MAG TPA: SCO family protein [Tepidisphaeraceae bacterium]|jgi:protein SCO1/2|nr:SCO family protein [Tepidisphaeraceae bacterium]
MRNTNPTMQHEQRQLPWIAKLAGAALMLAACCLPAAAGEGPSFSKPLSSLDPQDITPNALKDIGVDEHLNTKLPLDLNFQDDHGQTVTLGKYFTGKKPVILQLGYYSCPMLCSLVSQGTVDSLRKLSLTAGKDFEIIFVSIDPDEKPELGAAKKATYVQDYHRQGSADGFHFLTGAEPQIKQLAQAVGFKYKWVESARQFSHPAVVMIATPDGTISRYLYGVRFDNETMRLSLVEASDGKIGTTVDQILLTCFHYDGTQGKYAMTAVKMMRAGGALTLVILGAVLFRAFRKNARDEAAVVASSVHPFSDPKAPSDPE